MGRAIGMAWAMMVGVRVAGQLTFVPEHTKNGKLISARCTIPVYRNSHRGTNQKTGETGRTDSFKLVAWGKLAETCAKSLSKGKALDAMCEVQSYLGNLFNQDGSLRLGVDGQPIQIQKTSFTIMNIIFGEESEKMIAEEIQTGRRPVNWNVPTHPDYALWLDILKRRQASVWDGHSQTFGYARVVIPSGPGIVLGNATGQGQPTPGYATGYASAGAGGGGGYAPPFAASPASPASPGFPGHPGYGGGATMPTPGAGAPLF